MVFASVFNRDAKESESGRTRPNRGFGGRMIARMLGGLFDLTTAEEMLAKLRLEVGAFKADETARNAMNAVWTGYHLLEWIWNERLHGDAVRQARASVRNEADLRAKVKVEHPLFEVVRLLANGSKHFERQPRDPATGVHRGAFSKGFSKAFDVDYLFVDFAGTRHDIQDVLDGLLSYWENFYTTYLR